MTDKIIVKVSLIALLCCLLPALAQNEREAKKLFGGYKITPRFCRPTRHSESSRPGPNICMFNHECASRQGIVVGACMDGFLFGACCNLPGVTPGELLESENIQTGNPSNNLGAEIKTTKEPNVNIMSNGFSELTLTTAGDNDVIQIGNAKPDDFVQTGVTHTVNQETYLLNNENNEIQPGDFGYPSKVTQTTERGSTIQGSTPSYSATSPLIQISIGHNTPGYFQKPMFRPKPTTNKPEDDKYVLVPTITHQKPNKTQEFESIVNIIQMLNESSTPKPLMSSFGPSTVYVQTTSKKPPSTSYVFSTSVPKRPTTKPTKTTSRKPPSTSYVFSSTVSPKRTTKKPQTVVITSPKPSKPTKQRPTTIKIGVTPTKKPKPTTYLSTTSKRPVQTTSIVGPSFSVSPSKLPSSTPVIVFAPITEPSKLQDAVTQQPPVKPVTVTINNIVTATNNYYSTSQRPNPTIHITPKPPVLINTAGYLIPISSTEYPETEVGNNDLINFPPVRNPNLNISASIAASSVDEDEFTTPAFEDGADLDKKVASFVNKIVLSLQDPFNELKDIVYNKNRTTTKPPVRKPTTTKKPTKVGSTVKPTSQKPQKTGSTAKPGPAKPVTTKLTTKRPPTKKPTVTTKKPVTTTTRKPKPTRRPVTTPFPEEDEETTEQLDYRRHCGVRPLMKSGRIVGGKGATFGEWPWQVLVRESTWLGLFTKNKCGGVLISQRYVVTAAHCQPGFLASLVAVFGEFDISGELESKRSSSKNVRRVIVHRQYDAATFENDLALLELESPVQYDQHIVPICLPTPEEDFTGRMATVTGWGRLKYGGGVPAVLQEVQVPIMENHVCQEMFRTAGHSKIILDSFLCAGYANGQKDSCEGDSGGPLVLQRPDGRWELAGTVSHGIKCAAPYLPGVYMRTTYFKPWLESITGVH